MIVIDLFVFQGQL